MLSTTRRGFLAGTGGMLAAGLASAGTAQSAEARARAPRNIVLILADDLGVCEIGPYGQRIIKTPVLDRMAAQGVKFVNAFAGSSLCAPSRCSLLTGLHTGHTTVRENPEGGPQHALNPGDLTFAEVARLAGYRTALIGKWGFGPEQPDQDSHPNVRGYDEFYGYITHAHAHQYWPTYLWHNREMVAFDGATYSPDFLRDRAVKFIKESAKDGKPFLLQFATILPHSPSEIPGDAGRYQDEPWTKANRRHAAQVTRLDSHVGDILDALREAGVADDTVVVFTADNGPHHEKGVDPNIFNSNGPYRGVKRQLYDGGIRVPMIAWNPNFTHRVVDDNVALWDILPTVADFAGVPRPAGIDGRSLRPLLTGDTYEGHPFLVWNRPRKMQAIRRGHWKLIRFDPNIAGAGPEGRIELYDLRSDRGERHNVAKRYPDLVETLVKLLDRSIGSDPRVPYGLTARQEGGDVVVSLANGSTGPWNDVKLYLGTDDDKGIGQDSLAKGESFVATFPQSGKVAHARFRMNGEEVHFRIKVQTPPV